MVSKGGAGNPRWRNDGKELFYVGQAQQFAVDVTTEKVFQAGTPRRLFSQPLLSAPDVLPDGKRFLYAMSEGSATDSPYTVVLNWQATLRK